MESGQGSGNGAILGVRKEKERKRPAAEVPVMVGRACFVPGLALSTAHNLSHGIFIITHERKTVIPILQMRNPGII